MPFASVASRAVPRWRHLGPLLVVLLAVTGAPSAAHAAAPLTATTPARTVGFDGLVYASAYVGNTIYVGGSFRNAVVGGKNVVRKRLAALDARTGELLPWAPAADGTVFALKAFGTSLYATGKFTTVGGQSRPGLVGVHLTTGAVGPLKHTIKGGSGNALAAGGGRLYLGGAFTSVDGTAVRNMAAFRLADGALDTGFGAGADGQVKVLTVAGSRLYVGGNFKRLNGANDTGRFAALRLADGQIDAGFKPASPYRVDAVAIAKDRIYAGLAGPGGRVAAYRADGSLVWSTVTDGDVQALTYLRGVVYAGGHFTVACPQPSRTATSWCPATLRSQPKLVAFDGTTGWQLPWNPRSNGKWGVLTMSVNGPLGIIAVGGEFTAFNGIPRPYFAQFRLTSACGAGCGGRP
jgi:hypothetical protein